jgi:hypothetical protein
MTTTATRARYRGDDWCAELIALRACRRYVASDRLPAVFIPSLLAMLSVLTLASLLATAAAVPHANAEKVKVAFYGGACTRFNWLRSSAGAGDLRALALIGREHRVRWP